MRVCIYGAGAVGGFIGAQLSRVGYQVSAVARGATLDALRGHGFRVRSGEGEFSAPVTASDRPEELGPQDVVVVAVKAPALPAVARAVSPLLGEGTAVVSAMNGVPWWYFHHFGGDLEGFRVEAVDPGGVVSAGLPPGRVVGCVVHGSWAQLEPGLILHKAGNRLILGEPKGTSTERLERIAGALREAGFELEVSERIQADIWYKLWGNMTMNPISGLTGATSDLILDDPLVNRFCLAIMAEAAAIGARIGCPITESGEERNKVTRQLGAFKTSMLQDVEAGRPVELDALVTAVREIGRRVGESTASIDALLGLARLHARVRGLYPGPVA
jgi:2-dehydropantoate 2-reductase